LILKKREVPLQLLKLEALKRRLPYKHPKRSLVEENLARSKAGFKGEQSIEYPLSFLSNGENYILHDIRLLMDNIIFKLTQ
jgi:hypothetical protein